MNVYLWSDSNFQSLQHNVINDTFFSQSFFVPWYFSSNVEIDSVSPFPHKPSGKKGWVGVCVGGEEGVNIFVGPTLKMGAWGGDCVVGGQGAGWGEKGGRGVAGREGLVQCLCLL